jgi:hypothetical protein
LGLGDIGYFTPQEQPGITEEPVETAGVDSTHVAYNYPQATTPPSANITHACHNVANEQPGDSSESPQGSDTLAWHEQLLPTPISTFGKLEPHGNLEFCLLNTLPGNTTLEPSVL